VTLSWIRCRIVTARVARLYRFCLVCMFVCPGPGVCPGLFVPPSPRLPILCAIQPWADSSLYSRQARHRWCSELTGRISWHWQSSNSVWIPSVLIGKWSRQSNGAVRTVETKLLLTIGVATDSAYRVLKTSTNLAAICSYPILLTYLYIISREICFVWKV